MTTVRLSEELADNLAAVRNELLGAGYVEEELKKRLGLDPAAPTVPYLNAMAQPELIIGRGGPDDVDLLIMLFLVGAAVPTERLERLLSPESLACLAGCGLLSPQGAQVRANAVLLPLEGLLVLCDGAWRKFEPDYVFFPDAATLTLLPYLRPEPGERTRVALDVGTGSGLLALLLSKQLGFEHVVALDLNARATRFCAMSAALSGCELDVRTVPMREVAGALGGKVDLFTFSLPFLYTAPLFGTDGFNSANGEELLWETYSALATLLEPEGRAVVWHQLRTPVEGFLDALRSRGLADPLSVQWCPTPGNPPGVEFGVSLVRRRTPERPAFERIGCPSLLDGSRAEIAEHARSLALLRAPDWLRAAPYLDDRVTVQTFSPVVLGRLSTSPSFMIASDWYPAELRPLLEACDGRKSCEEVLAQTRAPSIFEPSLRLLVERGVLKLKPRAQG